MEKERGLESAVNYIGGAVEALVDLSQELEYVQNLFDDAESAQEDIVNSLLVYTKDAIDKRDSMEFYKHLETGMSVILLYMCGYFNMLAREYEVKDE